MVHYCILSFKWFEAEGISIEITSVKVDSGYQRIFSPTASICISIPRGRVQPMEIALCNLIDSLLNEVIAMLSIAEQTCPLDGLHTSIIDPGVLAGRS